jgi:hypothetical protein
MLGVHAVGDDIGDVISHVGDRAAADIDKGDQPCSAFSLERRVVAPDHVGSVLLRVASVELERIFLRYPFAERFLPIFIVQHG